jgi:coproporphyrinogen III oxidase-like Fe-S oxidoreductase
VRTANRNRIGDYINAVNSEKAGIFPRGPAVLSTVDVDRETEIGETMMVGLRLVDRGVNAKEFLQRFGESLTDKFGRTIERLERQGLLEWTDGPVSSLRLTRGGRLLGNRVFREFI